MNFPNQPRRTKIHLAQIAPATPDSSSTLIDCGTCIMRETHACSDCVVSFLFQEASDEHENEDSAPVSAPAQALALS